MTDTWRIPKRVWWVLLSWGVAVLMLATLSQWWAQLSQDRAMCQLTEAFMAAPDAVGDTEAAARSRTTRAALREYRSDRRCERFD